jgi:TonB family protein
MKPLTQERAALGATQVRRQRIDVVLVSSDDSFLIELGPLLGDSYRTHTVDSPLGVGDLLHKPGSLAIVDAATIPDARAAVARMAQRYPHAPIIVVAPQIAEWGAVVARGTIVAAIAREELAGKRLSEALAAAAARLNQEATAGVGSTTAMRRLVVGAEIATAATIDASAIHPAARSPRRPAPWPLSPLTITIVLVSAAVLALIVWLWPSSTSKASRQASNHAIPAPAAANAVSGTGATAPAVSATPGAPSASTRSQMILELLSAARVEFHDQKMLFPRAEAAPRGDTALELYAQVLSQDPGNAEALDGLSRLWTIAKARIQSDLAGGNLEDAARLVGLFREAGMQEDALQPLTASINAARPKWLLAHAQQSIAAGDLAAAVQWIDQLQAAGADRDTLAQLRRGVDAGRLEQQLTALSTQLQAAISAGSLLTPENDNALTRLNAMRALNRNDGLTVTGQRALRAALVARADEAIGQDQFDAAQRYLAAAAGLGGPAADLAKARLELQTAMQRTASASQATAASTPQSQSASPSGAAAAAPASAPATAPTDQVGTTPSEPATPAPGYIRAVPVGPLNVSYPPTAQGIEGRVILEFTLHPNGTASDVTVVEATPKGPFERAAINAVRRGRYDTRALVNDQPQRARISLHFKPG